MYLWEKFACQLAVDILFSELLEIGLSFLLSPMVLKGQIPLSYLTIAKASFYQTSNHARALIDFLVVKVEGQLGMERIWELMQTMTEILGHSKSQDLRSRWG